MATLNQIQDLGTVKMIAGDSKTFFINFKPQDESIQQSLVGYNCYFQLSPLGHEDVLVLSKLCELKSGSLTMFFTTLSNEDTDDLFGTFTIKIVLVDTLGEKLKNARGVLNILKDKDGII